MILTILGSGTSSGVPLIGCKCSVCSSRDKKNKRLRASAWLRVQDKSFLIDSSTDLRQQALTAGINRVDAVLYTHPHADHIHGIDELRSFNYLQSCRIPAYGNEWTQQDLIKRFDYVFGDQKSEGGGRPMLDFKRVDAKKSKFVVKGIKVIPLSLEHGTKECLGYRIGSFAYVTDCNHIPKITLNRMTHLDVLVLDCLRITRHSTHFNLEQALQTIAELKPKRTFLTHIGHDIDYKIWSKKLPKGVSFAYDGLVVKVERGRFGN